MKPNVTSAEGCTRRSALLGLLTAAMAPAALAAGENAPALVDVNVHLGRWPFRRLPQDEPEALVSLLRSNHVTQAWAAHYDGLLHEDLAQVNAATTDLCARHGPGLLLPVGVVNPRLPAWQTDLQRCVQQHQMEAIRLYPSYHGYTLADEPCRALLSAAAKAGVLVQIVAQMEDQRSQNPLVPVAPVDFSPLRELSTSIPALRIMVLNANMAMVLKGLRGCEKVWLDTAMIEGVGGLNQLLEAWPRQRVCLGSHAPFFYWQAAALKLVESAPSAADTARLTFENARSALA